MLAKTIRSFEPCSKKGGRMPEPEYATEELEQARNAVSDATVLLDGE